MKTSINGLIRIRVKAVRLHSEGHKATFIAKKLGVTNKSVAKWVKIHDEGGVRALITPPKMGGTCKLTPHQLKNLIYMLKDSPSEHGFSESRWTPKNVQLLIMQKFGVEYHPAHINSLLGKVGHKLTGMGQGYELAITIKLISQHDATHYGFSTPVWTARRVARIIKEHFGVEYSEAHICRYVRTHGWSLKNSQVTNATVLSKMLEIITTSDPKIYGYKETIWTANLVIELAKRLFGRTLNKPQVYVYLRRHGWKFEKQGR